MYIYPSIIAVIKQASLSNSIKIIPTWKCYVVFAESIYLSIYPAIYLSIYLSIYLYMYLSIYPEAAQSNAG